MRNFLVLSGLVAAVMLVGCSSSKSGGSSGSTGDTGSTASGTGSTGGSTGTNSTSGSTAGGTNGSSGTTATSLDAGLAAYCSGHGAPISVGDSASDAGSSASCLGNLAQRTFRFGLCTCDALVVDHPIDTDSFATLDGGLPDGGAGAVLAMGRHNGAVGVNLGLNEPTTGVHLNIGGSLWVSDGGVHTIQTGSVSGELHAGSKVDMVSSVGADAFCASDITGSVQITGKLYIPSSASIGSGVSYASKVNQPVAVADPCDCTQLVDIAGIVSSHAANNDNALIGQVSDGGFSDGGLPANLYASGTGPADFTFPCGRYYLSGVTINSGTTWHVNGRTAVMVAGDFTINAGFNIDVPNGSELDLFIAGNLNIAQPSTFGSLASVANTRFYVGGTGNIELNSPSNFYGNIYAPHATVRADSPVDVYGAIFSKAFVNTSPTHLHYDEDILSAGAECVPPPVLVDAGYGDGGGIFVDAGSPTCNSCTDCNNQACVKTNDAGPGVCGACTTSADCCAPLVCNAGTCVPVFR